MFPPDDILATAAGWQQAGHDVAVATVIATWGSSPRRTGSQLAVNDQAAFVGSVSGGCIEGAVIKEAMEIMRTGTPKLLTFTVSSEQAWEVGLTCGGQVEVYVEKLEP